MRMNEALCFNLRTSWQLVSRMYNSYAADHQVTLPMAYVLLTLKKDIPMPSTQITPALNMEASSMTRLIKHLEEKNFIFKKLNKDDGRQVNIYLTPEGIIKREIAKRTIENFNNLLREEVNEKDLNKFFEILEKVNSIAKSNHMI